jgi:hypothetical protein
MVETQFRSETSPVTVGAAVRRLVGHPVDTFVRRWNWKAALTSAIIRSSIFFSVNLTAGKRAAFAAMLAEFLFRAATTGFYGSFTQAFRRVEPAWQASVIVMFGLPLVSHSLEFTLHWLRGTPNLKASIGASIVFTVLSSLFNLYVMRRGAMIVGAESDSLWRDFARMPRLVGGFLATPFLFLASGFGRRA